MSTICYQLYKYIQLLIKVLPKFVSAHCAHYTPMFVFHSYVHAEIGRPSHTDMYSSSISVSRTPDHRYFSTRLKYFVLLQGLSKS